MNPPLIEAREIEAGHRGDAIITGISLHVARGELVALIGKNGAGKSTLIRTLAGLIRPLSGDVLLSGVDLRRHSRRELSRRMALLLEDGGTEIPFRVGEIVLMGRVSRPRGTLLANTLRYSFGFDTRDDVRAAAHAMAAVEVEQLADRFPAEISAGEWQRVRLARALARDPELLFLDEPTAHLDLDQRWKLYDLLDRMRRECDCGVLVVSHDFHPLLARADRVILLEKGRIVAAGPPSRVARPGVLAELFSVPFEAVRGFEIAGPDVQS